MRQISERTTLQEAQTKNVWEEVAKLQKALATAEAGTAPVRMDMADDDRPPNPTFLKVRAGDSVSFEAVKEAVDKLTFQAGTPSDGREVIGERKFFSLQFKGEVGLAAGRARKVLQIIKFGGAGGRFQKLVAGGQPLWVDPDKSPKQERTEAGGRRLKKLIAEVYSTRNVGLFHDEAVVAIDAKPLVRVCSPSPDSIFLEWHPDHPGEGIDRARIESEFATRFPLRGRDPWGG